MCGVITYPYNNKISMQPQEFTAACIKWVLEWVFEIWKTTIEIQFVVDLNFGHLPL